MRLSVVSEQDYASDISPVDRKSVTQTKETDEPPHLNVSRNTATDDSNERHRDSSEQQRSVTFLRKMKRMSASALQTLLSHLSQARD